MAGEVAALQILNSASMCHLVVKCCAEQRRSQSHVIDLE